MLDIGKKIILSLLLVVNFSSVALADTEGDCNNLTAVIFNRSSQTWTLNEELSYAVGEDEGYTLMRTDISEYKTIAPGQAVSVTYYNNHLYHEELVGFLVYEAPGQQKIKLETWRGRSDQGGAYTAWMHYVAGYVLEGGQYVQTYELPINAWCQKYNDSGASGVGGEVPYQLLDPPSRSLNVEVAFGSAAQAKVAASKAYGILRSKHLLALDQASSSPLVVSQDKNIVNYLFHFKSDLTGFSYEPYPVIGVDYINPPY